MELGKMQKTAHLMLHTLRSYPSMMMRHNTLPPFIHPSALTSLNVDNNDDVEPLNNCISLSYMLNSGVKGSRKLFWKNVRMECERLGEMVGWFRFLCFKNLPKFPKVPYGNRELTKPSTIIV